MSDESLQTLSDIIRGMQHAVNAAQETLQEHQFKLLQSYFNSEDGSPIMTWVTLPDGRKVDIPKIALIPQNMLAIEELEMDFSLSVSNSEVKKFKNSIEEVLPQESSRSSFQVGFARRGTQTFSENNDPALSENGKKDTIDVKIKFKSIPLPEGAARVQDLLNMGF
jgi:hypothetical protein